MYVGQSGQRFFYYQEIVTQFTRAFCKWSNFLFWALLRISPSVANAIILFGPLIQGLLLGL